MTTLPLRGAVPVALFVYGRPSHTRQTVEALKKNKLARETNLFVFSDAPKRPEAANTVREVREYLQTVDGFRSVDIVAREENFGLAKSIITGTTDLLERFGRVIVLEDDLVTSPYFLTHMNEALNKYAEDDRVISIHAYVYPTDQSLPEAFFLRGADCWGWATWKRGWDLFNPDGKILLDELRRRKLTRQFDFDGSYPYTKMLEDQILGKNDSWAVRWYASAFLADKLTLYPGRSLVQNIGNDASGTHCGVSQNWDTSVSESPINLDHTPVQDSPQARRAFENYFRKNHSGIIGRVRRRFWSWQRSEQHG